MKVNGANSSGFFEQISRNRKKENENDFESSFAGNLAQSAGSWENKAKRSVEEVNKEQGIDYAALTSGKNICGTSDIQKSSITPCIIQNISYKESDNVKVCIEDGCTYKAKVLPDKDVVYVERKNEDGAVDAFEVDVNLLKGKSFEYGLSDMAERVAVETYQNYSKDEEENVNKDFEKAFLKFYEYVRERIENGPPKFMIGSTEMSVEEWDDMLEKIDELLDEIKEERQERVEKQEQTEEKQKIQEETV